MAPVDVVVVSYNSRDRLRDSVAPLAGLAGVQVIVVDNASTDGSLETLDGLPVTTIPSAVNGGFAQGCNIGWRNGLAPYVLLLNPDATLDESSLRRLVEVLQADERVGAVAPKIVHTDGSLDHSIRRFPRLRSTYARALFLHRLFPRAAWTDEVVREEATYRSPGEAEWVSGACVLVRREALERLDGLDEGFFLYCEDKDLCKRLWDAGYEVRFEPGALAQHEGGASAPRSALLPILAASRVRYVHKHSGFHVVVLERLGLALGALTHIVLSRGGSSVRFGHARSMRVALAPTAVASAPRPLTREP
ncbi:MAG: glycosyltransferase family 2 protein [Gaiellaceae bacterium]